VGRDYDAGMDAYAHLLEALRQDDFRRLRSYAPEAGTKFTTWLVVVARRLCLDLERRKYGRAGGAGPEQREERAARRRLVDLVAEDLDPARLSGAADEASDAERREATAALDAALGELEPRDRLLLRLRFEESLGAPDIAATLGFPTSFHVYRRLNALLRRLRASLGARGIEGPGA
jgi:RNA polymerase sigma factor (sigma-70 family)